MTRSAQVLAIHVAFAVMLAGCGSSLVSATRSPSPSPSPTLSASDQSALAQLEARPLKLPSLLKGGVCRPDSRNPNTGLWGSDPVFFAGGPHSRSAYGDYYDVSAIIKPGLTGPVLLRARDLITPNRPLVFVNLFLGPSVYMEGPVTGTDPAFGPQYTELAIDATHPPAATYYLGSQEYHQFFWRQGIAFGWTGCVGFQADGPSFSEDVNVNVTPG